ncbi:MAG: dihydroorotase [Candidatus Micrarchaeota archaeon]|nr:dihydroorotase [Candidatus Micrarchaeota archaeon]
MIIRSGRVFLKNKLVAASIKILSEKIHSIHSYSYSDGDEIIDFKDKIILPGAIDGHVHFREPEAIAKEDFTTGSAAALAGGVCSILDMPCYNSPPTITIGALTEKEQIAARKSLCDFGFHFGASPTNVELIKKLQPPSLKGFLTKTNSPLTLTEEDLKKHFAIYLPHLPFLVHCEDQKTIDQNKLKYSEHHKIRSIKAAVRAVKNVNLLGRKFKRRVHFCHLTTATEVSTAKSQNKKLSKDLPGLYPNYFSCEVSPHHLFLSTADIKTLGVYANVNPPLRDKKEVAKLWKKLKYVDCIASDHAPHRIEDKENGASGFPGVQTMVPLVLDAVLNKKLKLQEAVRLFSSGPAKVFNIYYKGEIKEGYFADFIVFDPTASWQIKEEELFSKCGWSPFLKRTLKGKIYCTILRGQQAYLDGKILLKAGEGKPLIRTKQIGQIPLFLKKHSKEAFFSF